MLVVEKMADNWLEIIKSIATKAYDKIKDITGTYEGRKPVKRGSRGAGGDVTLKIDKLAEDVIIDELKKLNIPVKLITEETGIVYFNASAETTARDIITVDPIDGSHNAAMGFPISCISIAHSRGPNLSDVDSGVILNIYTGDVYYASKGKGAYKNLERIRVNDNSTVTHALFGISLSLGEPLPDFAERYSFIFQNMLKIRSFGSNAMGFAILAEGGLDCFMDLQKKCRSFDIAAGYIILREANGTMWDTMGDPLDAVLDISTRVSFICVNNGLKSHFEDYLPKFREAFKTQPLYKA